MQGVLLFWLWILVSLMVLELSETTSTTALEDLSRLASALDVFSVLFVVRQKNTGLLTLPKLKRAVIIVDIFNSRVLSGG